MLQPGYIVVPNLQLYKEEGISVFITGDTGPEWHRRPKPIGGYASHASILGDFLNKGALIADADICSAHSTTVRGHEREAVAFQVIDTIEVGSVCGDYDGAIYPGSWAFT